MRKTKTHPSRREMKEACCAACGVAWVQHDGIMRQCERLQEALRALRTLHTVATFGKPDLVSAAHVARVAGAVLEIRKAESGKQKSKPRHGSA